MSRAATVLLILPIAALFLVEDQCHARPRFDIAWTVAAYFAGGFAGWGIDALWDRYGSIEEAAANGGKPIFFIFVFGSCAAATAQFFRLC